MTTADPQPWQQQSVAPERLPMIGRDAFIARLARGEFGGQFPMLDLSRPPHREPPPHRGPGAFCDRSGLAHALAEGNAALGNPLDNATVDAIRGRGVMVIAGQQPGLLLGPMFTLLKAVTAVNAAERLSGVLDVPVVPAFWIASEDHDIEEVNRVSAGDHKLVLDHAELHRPGKRPPVGRVGFGEHRAEIEAFIDRVAAESPHGEAVRELTRDMHDHSYATQFGQMLARLMRGSGLVLVDPEWLRDMTAPVLAEAARRWDSIENALQTGRDRLGKLSLISPLESVKIFALDKWNGREAVTVSGEATAEAIEREPSRYSPSAALRPIVQDAVLPTVATVAGPTELLYLWEIDEIYAAMGIERSGLLPRLMATLIDDRTRRRAEQVGLHGEAILTVLERVREEAAHPPAADDADLREIESLAHELTRKLAAIDEEKERKTIERAVGSIRYRIDRVVRRVAQRRADRSGGGLAKLEKIAAAVYPHGELQERAASVLEMVGRYGDQLVPNLRALEVEPLEHHLLWAQPQPAGVKNVKEINA